MNEDKNTIIIIRLLALILICGSIGIILASQTAFAVSTNSTIPSYAGYKIIHNVGADAGSGEITFDVQYSSVKDIISATVSTKDNSVNFVLVGQTNQNSNLVLMIPTGLINGPFSVQIDNQISTNFTVIPEQGINVLTIPITPFTQQVSIVGTSVLGNSIPSTNATVPNPNAGTMNAYQYLQQEHSGSLFGGATVELDQKVYTWTDMVYITVVAPSCNTHPNIVDVIGYAGSCGTISIKTSMGQLNSYSLIETGSNTGIFTGHVTLTGLPNYDAKGDGTGYVSGITKGVGPTDGQIATSSNDNIQVTFTQVSQSVTGSAIIRWNIGEVSWLQTSYSANGQGVLQIVDPDMNLNPNVINTFDTKVWSSSDPNGINLTMTETGHGTGIFQGTVYFTTNLQSSGNILHVSEGDTITGQYTDRTLPPPYTVGAVLPMTATTTINTGTIQQSVLPNVQLNATIPNPNVQLNTTIPNPNVNPTVQTPTTEPSKIPVWVKNIFIWYGNGKISDNELLTAIRYLIQIGMIKV